MKTQGLIGDNMKTAREIIEKRKQLWQEYSSLVKDQAYIEAVAEHLLTDAAEELRQSIQNHPEYLIEMLFVIVDKDKKTVPFFLNDVQQQFIDDLNQAIEDYKAGKRLHLKFLVLKSRQQGFTSVITAYQLACSITQKNFAGFTLADDSENTETIFADKAKFPYSQLPESIRPTEKYNNRREFHFEKLNSRWRVATAGGKSVGRSKTLNFFHGSEAAFWDNLQQVLAGLGQALTNDSIQILESTANGYNEFKDLWDDGENWEQKFYEWWKTPEYAQNFETAEKEASFKQRVKTSPDWIYTRCKWLVEFIGLTWQQVYWYYLKWLDIKELIKQEYPCSADEAFLASGRCVFDRDKIIQRKEYLKKLYQKQSPKCGYFIFEWQNADAKDRIKDNTIKFIEDPNGYIWIYEEVEKGYPYVIGGDTKGEGSDFFAGTVINNVTGKRVAVLHRNLDPDTYTHQMYCLGRYYNNALIGIEINFDIYPVKELERLHYPRQYTRVVVDDKTNKKQNKNGWKTDGNTRPLIISNEIVLIRDNIDLFTHIAMLDECLTFVYDDEGRADAESGKHDDILFSDMIANKIREQQRMYVETTNLPRTAPRRRINPHTGY